MLMKGLPLPCPASGLSIRIEFLVGGGDTCVTYFGGSKNGPKMMEIIELPFPPGGGLFCPTFRYD